MPNLWKDIKKPLYILAPMEDVTDTVFRRIVASCGRPDVFFTEFTSTEGIMSPGVREVGKRLEYTETERPLVAQIWGEKPEYFASATKKLVEKGFDGIDINMGCPERSVLKKGACSALINNPPLAKEIIQATRDNAGGLPVSVKTRIGFKTITTEEWIGFLLEQNIDALTIHARTVKELSLVPAHWEEVKKAVALRNAKGVDTLIIGNGDINTRSEAEQRIAETNADGVMIGRGIFKDPWIFNREHNGDNVLFSEKILKLQEHLELFRTQWENRKSYSIMKKFFKCYVSNVPNVAQIRAEMMMTTTYDEALKILADLYTNVRAEEEKSALYEAF